MKITEILAKIAKGEELTDEEKAFAASWKEDEGRIPKKRLDEEIAKRDEQAKRADGLAEELETMKAKLEELQTSGMSEAEKARKESEKALAKLQKAVEDLTKERDAGAAKIAEMEFSGAVKSIAQKFRFRDSEYLGYRLKASGIDMGDDAAVSAFVKELEKTSPALFESEARPGGGTGTGSAGGASSAGSAGSRLAELLAKKELSISEAVEVNRLAEEAKANK